MFNLERKDWNQQKPQFSIGSKITLKCMKKCMKHENKWKMKGKKVLLALEDKNLWKFLRENDKSWLDLDRLKRESQKVFEKVWIVKNTWRKYVFEKLSERFSIDQQIDSIDRKLNLINPTVIKHRSNQVDSNQNFNHIFDRSKNKFNWSKIWKTQFFEKLSNFMQKLLKTLNFMNKMHEYKMKCFSKTLVLNPFFPKLRFSIDSP